jgi:hypothetical protein
VKTEFYTCDVCGGEIDPKGPCHRAVEISYPDAYLPSYETAFADRKSRYVCNGCLPLRVYRPKVAKQSSARTTLWNVIVAHLWNVIVAHLRGES